MGARGRTRLRMGKRRRLSLGDVEEILAAAVAPQRTTKLQRWLAENPKEGEVYLEVMRRGLAEGRAFQHLHSAAQVALGGPDVSPQAVKPQVMLLLAD